MKDLETRVADRKRELISEIVEHKMRVSDDVEVRETPEAPLPGAEEDDPAKPALDGSRFHDQSRFRSPEVTAAFASVTRAASQGPRSDTEPDEVAIDPDVAISDTQIVRGVD